MEYALFIHSLISELGYCSSIKPEPQYRKIEYNYNNKTNKFIPSLSSKRFYKRNYKIQYLYFFKF
jgi:hypothetical protein